MFNCVQVVYKDAFDLPCGSSLDLHPPPNLTVYAMQFAVLALSAFTLFSSTYALTLNTPDLAVSGEPIDITWENGPHDSTFSLELFSPTLQDSFALAKHSQLCASSQYMGKLREVTLCSETSTFALPDKGCSSSPQSGLIGPLAWT